MGTPVEWLEATYAAWERVDHVGGGVRYRPTGEVIVQPMFMLKSDLRDSPPPRPCHMCAYGASHRCEGCGDEIAHMTGLLCPSCWDAHQ